MPNRRPLSCTVTAEHAEAFRLEHHTSRRDRPAANFRDALRFLPEQAVRTLASSRITAGLVAGSAMVPAMAHASTLNVVSADDTGFGSLRDAVENANAGDTIVFDPTLNGQTITLSSGSLNIRGPLTIQGPGSSLLTIDGGGTLGDAGLTNGSRIFYLYAATPPSTDGGQPTPLDVTISGLTLQHGNNGIGGGGHLCEGDQHHPAGRRHGGQRRRQRGRRPPRRALRHGLPPELRRHR